MLISIYNILVTLSQRTHVDFNYNKRRFKFKSRDVAISP